LERGVAAGRSPPFRELIMARTFRAWYTPMFNPSIRENRVRFSSGMLSAVRSSLSVSGSGMT